MNLPQLRKIIKESIKELMNEEKNCKQEFTDGVEACLSQYPNDDTAFDACYATVKLNYKKCTGKDWDYYKTGHRDIDKKNEGVDSTCRNKGFCCKEKFTKRNKMAFSQNNICMCPKGSVRVNCPK
jgi:hypothetical protein